MCIRDRTYSAKVSHLWLSYDMLQGICISILSYSTEGLQKLINTAWTSTAWNITFSKEASRQSHICGKREWLILLLYTLLIMDNWSFWDQQRSIPSDTLSLIIFLMAFSPVIHLVESTKPLGYTLLLPISNSEDLPPVDSYTSLPRLPPYLLWDEPSSDEPVGWYT